MSARRDWVITCDAVKVGLPVCSYSYTSETTNLNLTRKEMRTEGWVRKGHDDILVDLCPRCSEKAVTKPAHVPGRGRPKGLGV